MNYDVTFGAILSNLASFHKMDVARTALLLLPSTHICAILTIDHA